MNPFTFNTDLLEWELRYAQTNGKVVDPIQKIIQSSISASCTIFVRNHQGNWSGSGFHIGNGIIATASHVCPPELANQPSEISVTFDGKTLYPAQIVASQPAFDCALLSCPPVAKLIDTVSLADSDNAQVGDIIAVIGSPEGWHDTATVGRISNVHQELGRQAPTPAWNDIIFIDAEILQGASGGMVLGTDGLVYGLVIGVTGQHAELGIGENSCCPSNKIKALLQSLQK